MRWRFNEAFLTSVKHGPFAQRLPAGSGGEQSVVRDHGSVVTPAARTAFRTPALVHLNTHISTRTCELTRVQSVLCDELM